MDNIILWDKAHDLAQLGQRHVLIIDTDCTRDNALPANLTAQD
jgi:hypothetical protein